MKKVIFVFIFSIVANALSAQLLQKQYVFNQYSINAAAAGEQSFAPVYLGFRQQFSGHTSAPKIYFASYNGRVGDNVSLGIDLGQDQSQSFTSSYSRFSYAYRLKLNSKQNLSFGLSARAYQLQGDYSGAIVVDPNDPLAADLFESTVAIDADFGAFLNHSDYYLGLSANNIFKTKLYYGQTALEPKALSRGVLLHGGYHFSVGSKLLLTPAFLMESYEQTPLRLDVNATATYDEFLKLGLSYQNSGVLGAYFGMQYQNLFFGYMFDLNNTALNKPSHELMVGYFRPLGESKRKRLNRLKIEKEKRKHKDTDGDGVMDVNDECPNSWGLSDNNGCPQITEDLETALESIQKAIYFVDEEVSDESMPAMMKLGSLLLTNKGVKLRISGAFSQTNVLSEYLLNRWSITPKRIEQTTGNEFNLHLFAD